MSDIEHRLRAAAATLDTRPVPDIAARVRVRLEDRARPAASRVRTRWATPRWVAPVAVALAAVVVSLWMVPTAGVAVADFLGLDGLRIVMERRIPGVDASAHFGSRVSLSHARAATAFPVPVPDALGEPDEVWLDREAVPGGQVTVRWRETGALLTVLSGSLDPGLLAKSVWSSATEVSSVRVGDGVGWWVSGDAHALVYRDAAGTVRTERSRLAGDTLLWQSGDVLYRLEGLPRERALAVARSLP